jgi:hypothetical protein
VPCVAVSFAIPVERPDPEADRTPLTIEVLSRTVPETGDFSARVRFYNRTRRPISVTGPIDNRWQCVRSPVPVIVFAVFPEGKRGEAFPGLVAETPNNLRLGLPPGSQVTIAPRAWIDVDFIYPIPMDWSRPLALRCVYSNPRPDGADPAAGRPRDNTFYGQLSSAPLILPERKVGP